MHYQKGGCYHGLYVHTGSKPTGWLALYDTVPLSREDLSLIPQNVHWAWAGRLSSDKLFDDLISFVALMEPEAQDDIQDLVKEFEEEVGIHPGDDLLNLIGDTVMAFDAPEDGGLLFTGITLALKTSDAPRLQKSLHKIVEAIAKEAADEFTVKVTSLDYREHRVEFVNMTGIPMPFAPAWTTHEDWMIIGLYPQVVRNSIDRLLDNRAGEDSLLANPDFVRGQKCLGSLGSSVAYIDSKRGAEDTYAFLLPLAQAGLAMWQGYGGPMHIGALPSRTALTKHLFGDVFTTHCDGQGVLYTSYGPLPMPVPTFGASGNVATVALLTSILLPSLSRARELSKRLVSQAQVKSILDACHMYAREHGGQFPPGLETLVREGLIEAETLRSPKYEPGRPCYLYISGQTIKSHPGNIVVHERLDMAKGEGVNVGFVDGYLEFLRMPAFEQAMRETKERLEKD